MNPDQWRRVQALLEEAVALAPPDRAAFLDRACPDPDDRRHVEDLLHHHDEAGDFLEEGAGRLAAEMLSADELVPGQVLGAYRITRELGRGGMGVVYLARDLRLDRDVAIKMLPPDFRQDPRRRERLQHEARAAAAVAHAGIAHVYALEQDDRGAGFVVSEYVAGHTLRDEIARGALTPAAAVDTALQVAAAVGAAHARGIIHRDLKPENVMRTPAGAIKVLDFGLARMTGPVVDQGRQRLTVTGAAMGTPGYMSPEQLRGGETGPATDVFAVGLLLQEMLTGRHPFDGGPDATTAVIVRILEGVPEELPDDVTRALPGIDRVVTRCLEKRPGDRYQSMEELSSALASLGVAASGLSRTEGGSAHSRQESSAVARDNVRAAPPGTARIDWWQVHQIAVSVLYVSMVYPAWKVRGAPIPTWAHNVMFLALVVAAALATTLRLNGVFTARVHHDRLGAVRRRARPLTRSFDWLLMVALLSLSAAALARDQIWLAALFATVAASATVGFLLIEPATAEATFGEDDLQ